VNNKIYRNGQFERDSTSKILTVNLGVLGISIAVAFVFTRWMSSVMGDEAGFVNTLVFGGLISLGVLVYVYLTVTRIRPLARIDGDTLVVYSGVFSKRTVDLLAVEKITFQHSSEHDQRMKVKYPRKIASEFIIKQTNCSVEDLTSFIQSKHEVDVSYS